jgi:hypothetical protein
MRNVKWTLLWAALLGTISSPAVHATAPSSTAVRNTIQDVELNRDGQIWGQIVDSQGNPVAGSEVSVKQQGKLVATTRSSTTGHFAIADLRPGLYELSSLEQNVNCRVWAHETAPPAAQNGIVLGQMVPGFFRTPRGIIITSAVVAGAVAAIVLANADSDDNAS